MRSLRTKKAFTRRPPPAPRTPRGPRPSSSRRRRWRPRAPPPRHELAQRAEAGRQQYRPLGVHVVLRLLAARERDLARSQERARAVRHQPSRAVSSIRAGSRLQRSGSATRLPIVVRMGSFVRLVAIVTPVIVLLGFALLRGRRDGPGSKTQQNTLDRELRGAELDPAPIAPTPGEEAAREDVNSSVREVVDDANDVLLGPFTSLIDSNDRWVSHGVPALLALLLYGLGLGTAREHAAQGARDTRRLAHGLASRLSPSRDSLGVRRATSPARSCCVRNSKSSAESGRPPGRPERGNQLGGSRATGGESRTRVPRSASSSASPSANPVGPKGRGHG